MKKQLKQTFTVLLSLLILMGTMVEATTAVAITTNLNKSSTAIIETSTEAGQKKEATGSTDRVEPQKIQYNLLTEKEAQSSRLAVIMTKQEFTQKVSLEGKITAGKEGNTLEASNTYLKKLVLQRKDQTTDWQTIRAFELFREINVSEKDYSFEFSEALPNAGIYTYQLVAEAEVKNQSNLLQAYHNASLELGEVEIVESTVGSEQTTSEEVVSEVPVTPESVTTSTEKDHNQEMGIEVKDSLTVTEDRIGDELTDEELDLLREQIVIKQPSTVMEDEETNIPTLNSDSDIPTETNQNTKTNFLTHDLTRGIMPLVSNNAVWNQVREQVTTPNYSFVYAHIYNFDIVSAEYTATNRVKVRVHVRFHLWRRLTANSYGEVYINVTGDSTPSGWSATNTTSSIYSFRKYDNGPCNLTIVSSNPYQTTVIAYNRERDVTMNDIYYDIDNIATDITRERVISFAAVDSGHTHRIFKYGSFSTQNAVDLTWISTPMFNQTSASANGITMNNGTYTGDTTNTSNDGRLDISANNGSSVASQTAVSHTIIRNGTYYGKSITGLAPGSTYVARMMIPNWLNQARYSTGWSAPFYTTNTVNTPSIASRGTPTTGNDATLTFNGTYNVGVTPAHATDVRARYSTDNVNWTTATITKSINTGTRNANFTISGLAPNTNYYVQFSVYNASTKWSAWSGSSAVVKTLPVNLVVNAPQVTQTDATASTIPMVAGTFTGNNSGVNEGTVRVSSDNGANWNDKTFTLGHTTGLNGTYNNYSITDLPIGSSHLVQVGLKNVSSTYVYSTATSFYTTNTVDVPNIVSKGTPSTLYDASASLEGNYVADGISAHPDEVAVRIGTDNNTFSEIDGTTTPELSSSSTNDGIKQVSFTIEQLLAGTTYYVQYRVKNAGGWSEWSTSKELETLERPAGTYFNDHPTFDFGTHRKQTANTIADLTNSSTKNHLEISNTDTNVGWSLSAEFSDLKRVSDNLSMPWASLEMAINLQKDNAGVWEDYAIGVVGVPRTVTLTLGASSQVLWNIPISNNAQGSFRNEIDWDSVKLTTPGNLEGNYQGSLIWSLNNTL